jgi:hypothetical protein
LCASGAEVIGGFALSHEPPVGPHDEPEAAELRDVLAADGSRLTVADPVVKGTSGVRDLPVAVRSPYRGEERRLEASTDPKGAPEEVRRPGLRTRLGASATAARITRERVQRVAAIVEQTGP